MTAPIPIIQPDQWIHEHRQNPTGNDPVDPDKIVNRDQRLSLTIGGLSCREEIASRILAGMWSCSNQIVAACKMAQESGFTEEELTVHQALKITDALLAKTRPQPEGG